MNIYADTLSTSINVHHVTDVTVYRDKLSSGSESITIVLSGKEGNEQTITLFSDHIVKIKGDL